MRESSVWLRAQWDRVGAWLLIVGGLLALLLGWLGVSGTAYPAEQLPYIVSGGLFGIALIAIGVQFWLSADLRDEWRKLDRLQALLTRDQSLNSSETQAESNGSVARSSRTTAVRSSGSVGENKD